MARRRSVKDAFYGIMVIVGILFYIVGKILEIITDNLVFVAIISLLALAFFILFIWRKKYTEQIERSEKQSETAREIALSKIRLERLNDKIVAFRNSNDYSLIINFVTQYGFRPNINRLSLQELNEVIAHEWQLDEKSILMLLEKENEMQQSKKFEELFDRGDLYSYESYLERAIDTCGEKFEDYGGNLRKVLIQKRIILPQTSVVQIHRDLSTLKRKMIKARLLDQTVENQKFIGITDIDRLNPLEFEKLISSIYQRKGYSVKMTNYTGDQGADVIIEKLGERIVIQAKLYARPVGNKAVQEVCAAIKHYEAKSGIVITNNYFTNSAHDLAYSNKIALIDRNELIKML